MVSLGFRMLCHAMLGGYPYERVQAGGALRGFLSKSNDAFPKPTIRLGGLATGDRPFPSRFEEKVIEAAQMCGVTCLRHTHRRHATMVNAVPSTPVAAPMLLLDSPRERHCQIPPSDLNLT
jgi:hypothetical protein